MKAANRLKAVDDQVSGQNDLGDYHDNGLYYSQHQRAEFAYDANGNLEQDMNRNIGIKYGILHNLPIYLTYRQTGGGGITCEETLQGFEKPWRFLEYPTNNSGTSRRENHPQENLITC